MTFQPKNQLNNEPTDQQVDTLIDKSSSHFPSTKTHQLPSFYDSTHPVNVSMTEDLTTISIDSGCYLSHTSTQSFQSLHSDELEDKIQKLNIENIQSFESDKMARTTQTLRNNPSTNQLTNQQRSQQMINNQQAIYQSFSLPQNSDGDTILHLAVIQSDFKQLASSLRFLKPHHLNHQNHTSLHTPLHLASVLASLKIARLLVLLGSSTSLQDRSGDTPLHIACNQGNLELIKQLTLPPSTKETTFISKHFPNFFQNSASPPPSSNTCSAVDLCNYDGKAPLHLAYFSDHPDRLAIIEFLVVSCAACVNVVEGKSGYSLLHEMVKVGDDVGISALFNLSIPASSPPLLINNRCYGNMTALDMAVCLGRDVIEGALRDRGGECSEYHSFKMDE